MIDENRKLELVKIKRDKDTKEESMAPLTIYEKDISSLYKNAKGVFIVTNQAFMHKVPYTIDELKELLRI